MEAFLPGDKPGFHRPDPTGGKPGKDGGLFMEAGTSLPCGIRSGKSLEVGRHGS